MRTFLHKLPALVVLGLGTALALWGGHVMTSSTLAHPVAPEEGPRFCAPTLTEVLGFDGNTNRPQAIAAVVVGGVAAWFSLQSLRRGEEVR
jgi:hypothetical protein